MPEQVYRAYGFVKKGRRPNLPRGWSVAAVEGRRDREGARPVHMPADLRVRSTLLRCVIVDADFDLEVSLYGQRTAKSDLGDGQPSIGLTWKVQRETLPLRAVTSIVRSPIFMVRRAQIKLQISKGRRDL
jgi:hypothetical protein